MSQKRTWVDEVDGYSQWSWSISKTELQEALKDIKNRKATELDKINTELFKHGRYDTVMNYFVLNTPVLELLAKTDENFL